MKGKIFKEGVHFSQCHASSLLALKDGRLLCVCFAGEHEKASDVGIWQFEFDGKQWKAPREIAKICGKPHWNPVLFKVKDGIRIVFKVGEEIASWKSYTMHSKDGGATWENLHGYPENPAGGPVRSKPIRLSNGALLAPNSDEEGGWRTRVDISWDEGETFKRYAEIPLNLTDKSQGNYICGRGAIQPTMWEDEAGEVHALLRTSAGRIYRSDSQDGGKTWCQAYPLEIPNNNSGIDILKSKNGKLYLALNPTSGDFVARTPLCIYESRDQGKHFEAFVTLEDELLDAKTGKTAEFSYPSLTEEGDLLFVSYTWNRRCLAVQKVFCGE